MTNKVEKTKEFYGKGFQQINLHGGDSLHIAGFCGEGMHVAVIDAGFYNVDQIKFFKKMHLLGTRDFVNPKSDIYAENNHGMDPEKPYVYTCSVAPGPIMKRIRFVARAGVHRIEKRTSHITVAVSER